MTIISSFISYRVFSQENIEKFKTLFNSIDFIDVFTASNADDSYTCFHNKLKKSFDEVFPIKKKKSKLSSGCPWITLDLKFCLKKKFRLLKMVRNNQITKKSFNIYKKLLNTAIKQAKKLYYLKKAISANRNIKDTWKFFNKNLNKNKKKTVLNVNNSEGVLTQLRVILTNIT